MTSLLPALPRTYPHLGHQPYPQPSHGKQRKIASKLHPMYYTGVPTEQFYDLTLLKRSNIRSNDQLLPRPTQVDMSSIKINQMFPAEHPYSSHISKFAMFPSFSRVRDDYKTGTEAQQERPLHPQIPANPYSTTVHNKSKGAALHQETLYLPHDSEKKALHWPGDNFFQQVKSPNSGQQQFYPIPPKAILPNHAPRKLDNTLNPHTANALRNVERSQWATTYSNNFSGYGPSNALRLDNYDEKVDKEQRSGIEDHSLSSPRNALPYLRKGTQRTYLNNKYLQSV